MTALVQAMAEPSEHGRVGLLRIINIRGGYALLDGELDAATAPILRELVEEPETDVSLIDLSGLTFVDSSGLRALLRTKQTCPAVSFVFPSPQLRRLVELTGTHALLFDE